MQHSSACNVENIDDHTKIANQQLLFITEVLKWEKHFIKVLNTQVCWFN